MTPIRSHLIDWKAARLGGFFLSYARNRVAISWARNASEKENPITGTHMGKIRASTGRGSRRLIMIRDKLTRVKTLKVIAEVASARDTMSNPRAITKSNPATAAVAHNGVRVRG